MGSEHDSFMNQRGMLWEHTVVKLIHLNSEEVTKELQTYERDGWQVAATLDRGQSLLPLLILKRPKE